MFRSMRLLLSKPVDRSIVIKDLRKKLSVVKSKKAVFQAELAYLQQMDQKDKELGRMEVTLRRLERRRRL